MVKTYLELLELEADKAVAKVYKKSLDSIRGKVSAFYEKYEKNGKLDYTEAVKYNRLANFEKDLRSELKILGQDLYTVDKQYVAKLYKAGYYDVAYKVSMKSRTNITFTKPAKETVDNIINQLVAGATINERIAKMITNDAYKYTAAVRSGLTQGLTVSKLRSNIKDTFNKSAYEATRIVRTESHRALVEGKVSGMAEAEDLGVKIKKMWVASMDSRTRDTHSELDGEKVNLDEDFEWIAADGSKVSASGPGLSGNPGEDINCRCSVIEVIEGFEPEFRSNAKGDTIPYVSREKYMEINNVQI